MLEQLINEILETHIFSYIEKSEQGGFCIGIVLKSDYHNKDIDYQQKHFTGKTFLETIKETVNFLT